MFGLNNAQIIGRLGADATVSPLTRRRPGRQRLGRDRRELHGQELGRQGRPHRVAPHRHLPGRPGRHAGEAREEGPPGLRLGQAPDPQVAQGRRGQRPLPRPRSCWSRAAGCSSSTSRTATQRRRRTATLLLPPPRRWMTARFPSRRASSLPPTQGRFPPIWRGTGPFFLPSVSSRASQSFPYRRPRATRLRMSGARQSPSVALVH